MADNLASLPLCRTKRLVLRPLEAWDAEALRILTDDPLIAASIPFLPHPFTQADAATLIQARDTDRDCFVGAWRHSDGDLIGVVGAHLRHDKEVEIGYWIGTAFRGAGYATEATKAVIAMIRRGLPERRVVAECHPDDLASWRILEKLGFRDTGAQGTRAGCKLLALTPDCL